MTKNGRKSRPSFPLDFGSWIHRRLLKRPLLSLVLALFGVLTSVIIYQVAVRALSNDWVQTDWSGGADTGASADNTNLLNWTKYYSGTNIDHGTSGEVKLQRTLSQP